MKSELDKIYQPTKYEDEIYRQWERSGYFNPDNLTGAPYSILMPPPNVTGVLHLGHALENSLMDIMARYHRMLGQKVLLLPGTDHAAVATQAKVEKLLVKQGIKNPRQELGRQELLKRIKAYAENSQSTILKQIKKMGTSCDWSRLAYTFDQARSRAVNEVFLKMYNDGLIYRGYRVINWSVKGQSTCSDDELVYLERQAKLYTFKYDKDFPFCIATTRPETKLGDTAVAVNPQDKRYRKYIGKTYTVNVGAARPLEIRVIADENIDPQYGSGAVGLTPAHSPVDFEIYEKQKAQGEPIELIQVIGLDGCMTDQAGRAYRGLKAEVAREKLIKWLKNKNLLEKEEDISHSVGTSDRFGDVVEALPMTQWFVDVNKKIPGQSKSLKNLMRQAVTTGHNNKPENKIKITPARFEKIYLNWIDNLRDWCISRQIWWGHRIPVWYRNLENGPAFAKATAGKQQKADDSKIWNLKIYGKDIFNALVNGTKTIETRAGRPQGKEKYWGDIKPGNIIEFVLADDKTDTITKEVKSIKKLVKKVTHFNTIAEMFKIYKPEQAYPGKSAQEIKQWWKKYPNLDERIKRHGIWAIELDNCTEEEIYVGVEPPQGKGWQQDEDTLDTWFSSGLWTFSTLGWPAYARASAGKPDKTKDLKTFHPTSWMQMGYEIIFFWMARMILMSTYAIDQIPFRDVYIHGMLRDDQGRKFSKSLGNIIDPIDVCQKYGTDALRLALISGTAPGHDMNLGEEKIAGSRNFVNKLWNVARYILQTAKNRRQTTVLDVKNLTNTDIWILNKMGKLINDVSQDLDNYRFPQASERLREFSWNDFADWYIEASKFENNGGKADILTMILKDLLRLWHPFMPFITETVWQLMGEKKLLMVESWPDHRRYKIKSGPKTNNFDQIKNIIVSIRNARSNYKIEPAQPIKAVIYAGNKVKLIAAQAELIKKLRTGIRELEIRKSGKKIKQAIYLAAGRLDIYLQLPGFDFKKEKQRMSQLIDQQNSRLKAQAAKLTNQKFIKRAPERIVKQEKDKLELWQEELKKLEEQLANLN